jgi:hypothetical protein
MSHDEEESSETKRRVDEKNSFIIECATTTPDIELTSIKYSHVGKRQAHRLCTLAASRMFCAARGCFTDRL